MNINDILAAFADDKSILLAHPDTVRRIEEMGAIVDRPAPLTPEEAVAKLFAHRKAAALEIVPQLPDVPDGIPVAIVSLYEEIIPALLFDLHGAAITLSAILVEFGLKFATYMVEVGSTSAEAYDPERWAELENIAYYGAVVRAAAARLIEEDHRVKLLEFKDDIRNPYSHYNIQKICSGWGWANVRSVHIETGEVEVGDKVIADDPVLQAQAKPEIDRRRSLDVFGFADRVVQHVFATGFSILQARDTSATESGCKRHITSAVKLTRR